MLLRKQEEELKIKQRVMRLEADIDEEFEEENGATTDASPEGLLASLLIPMFQQTPKPVDATAVTSSQAPTGAETITDEQIKATWEAIPEWQKQIAKSMSDEKVKEYIKQRQPNVTPEILERALKVVRA